MNRWMPPAFLSHVNGWRGAEIGLRGSYTSWNSACERSSGYDSGHILERVLDASRQVRDGRAAYERDSVLFDRVEYSFPLLAVLLRVALERDRALSVLDFGGALGGSYRECRPFLGDCIGPLRWAVVEQPSFVAAGRREMQNEELSFFSSIGEAARDRRIDVVLFSAVLQYLPTPYETLDEALRIDPHYLVLDRTIVAARSADIAHVQTVPDSIYPASYPVWSLSRERLLRHLQPGFEMLSEHMSLPFPALQRIDAEFKGFIFQNKRIR
jgi:putative methyltransferase (TIGR04325 family)